MPRRRHTPEQVIRKLREAEVELAKGLTTYTRDRVPGRRIHRSAATSRRRRLATSWRSRIRSTSSGLFSWVG